jgi:exosortase
MVASPEMQPGEVATACAAPAAGARFGDLARRLPLILAIGSLWWKLIDHLRIEWALNPQYAYGWAVPFLTLFLIWERWRVLPSMAGEGRRTSEGQRGCPSRRVIGVFFLLALSYSLTRFIQEANPDWRLVSWALVTIVVATTFLAGSVLLQAPPTLARWTMLPVTFVLVAVPWPTPIETPLIQALTRANASISIELLQLIGVPAIQHGNVIEVGTGVVGIDEACSGIRSFQAALMFALFFAFFRRMALWRGLVLCVTGFGFSFVFNVIRTTLLTWVASRQGVAAMAKWHDAAAASILLTCLLAVWLMAECIRGGSAKQELAASIGRRTSAFLPIDRALWVVSMCALCWVLLVEGLVAGWYSWHEQHLSPPAEWAVLFPRANPGFRERPFSEKTRRFLRFDEGSSAEWEEADGTRWQGIFLRWDAGRIAAFLARSHTPEVCLTASGHKVVSQSEPRSIEVKGLSLPFRCYEVETDLGPLRVYYFLREDHAPSLGPDLATTLLTYQNRFEAVLAGRRNLGQRSLELAVLGIDDAVQADQVMARQLENLLVTK